MQITHGTLNIYIYDTQHLKHNGFTETKFFSLFSLSIIVLNQKKLISRFQATLASERTMDQHTDQWTSMNL